MYSDHERTADEEYVVVAHFEILLSRVLVEIEEAHKNFFHDVVSSQHRHKQGKLNRTNLCYPQTTTPAGKRRLHFVACCAPRGNDSNTM